jgi:hypothetical protein
LAIAQRRFSGRGCFKYINAPLGEGAKREPDRAKPQQPVRISGFGRICDPHPARYAGLFQRERLLSTLIFHRPPSEEEVSHRTAAGLSRNNHIIKEILSSKAL